MTFSIHSIPYYNEKQQRYEKVLCLDRQPSVGSQLNHLLKRVKFDKVSPFKQGDSRCSVVIMNPTMPNEYAHIDTITVVIDWLKNNGFKVDLLPTVETFKINSDIICFIDEVVTH